MWVRLESEFFRHPKVIGLPGDAKLVYLHALCYTAESGLNGRIPGGAIKALAAGVGVFGDAVDKAANDLLQAGLWDRHGVDFGVHDFADWNPSNGELAARQKQRAEAGRKGGLARAERALVQAESKRELKHPLKQTPSDRLSKRQAKPKHVDADVDVDVEEDVNVDVTTANAAVTREDGGDGELVQALRSRRVNGAARLVKEHGAERCQQAIAYVDSLEGVESWTGMLVTVVKSGEPIPSPLEDNSGRAAPRPEQPLYRDDIGLTQRGKMFLKQGWCDEKGNLLVQAAEGIRE